ncbi:hypothetical protein K8I31_14100, partial [bacterium]|nr:hypothetical protein [bacterium]
MRRIFRQSMIGACSLFAAFAPIGLSFAADANLEGIEFFEKRVRPVLAENCYLCHGSQLQQAKLSLNSPSAILAGGNNG